MRPEFFALAPRPPEGPLRLLVMGGSQGARALNQRMPEIAKPLLDLVPDSPSCIRPEPAMPKRRKPRMRPAVRITAVGGYKPFLEDMPRQFAMSDLILARSGASTVAELAASGKPSLLVPFPQAADDHQRKNAEVLAEGRAAMMLLEHEMTADRLLNALSGLLSDRNKLQEMAACARTFAHPQAAARIAEMVAGLVLQ